MDQAARALGEPTRRAILELVQADEMTVTEIASNFKVSRPAISQHLRVLDDAGLVNIRQAGTRRFYQARPEGLAGLREWIDGFWVDALDRLAIEVERDEWVKRKNESKKRKKNQ